MQPLSIRTTVQGFLDFEQICDAYHQNCNEQPIGNSTGFDAANCTVIDLARQRAPFTRTGACLVSIPFCYMRTMPTLELMIISTTDRRTNLDAISLLLHRYSSGRRHQISPSRTLYSDTKTMAKVQ